MLNFLLSNGALAKCFRKALCIVLAVLLSLTMFTDKAFAQSRIMLDSVNNSSENSLEESMQNDVSQISDQETFNEDVKNSTENVVDDNSDNADTNIDDAQQTDNVNGSNKQSLIPDDSNFTSSELYKSSSDSNEESFTKNNSPYYESAGANAISSNNNDTDDYCLVWDESDLKTALNGNSKVLLLDDIQLTDDYDFEFSGILNGNGHTIYSYRNDSKCLTSALFSKLSGYSEDLPCEICNLTLDWDKTSDCACAGILANRISGYVNISCCTFTGNIKSGSNKLNDENYSGSVAGFVEANSHLNMTEVLNSSTIECGGANTRYAGGFIGFSESATINIQSCSCDQDSQTLAYGARNVAFDVSVEVVKAVALIITGTFLMKKMYKKSLENDVNNGEVVNKLRKSFAAPFKNARNALKRGGVTGIAKERMTLWLELEEEIVDAQVEVFVKKFNEYKEIMQIKDLDLRNAKLWGSSYWDDVSKSILEYKGEYFWLSFDDEVFKLLNNRISMNQVDVILRQNNLQEISKMEYDEFASFLLDHGNIPLVSITQRGYFSTQSSMYTKAAWVKKISNNTNGKVLTSEFVDEWIGLSIFKNNNNKPVFNVLNDTQYSKFLNSKCKDGRTVEQFINDVKKKYDIAYLSDFPESHSITYEANLNDIKALKKECENLGNLYTTFAHSCDSVIDINKFNYLKLKNITQEYFNIFTNEMVATAKANGVGYEKFLGFFARKNQNSLRLADDTVFVAEKFWTQFKNVLNKKYQLNDVEISEIFFKMITNADFMKRTRQPGDIVCFLQGTKPWLITKQNLKITPSFVQLLPESVYGIIESNKSQYYSYPVFDSWIDKFSDFTDPEYISKFGNLDYINGITKNGIIDSLIIGASGAFDALHDNISKACASFPSSEGGLGGIHYDGYSGGFIGAYHGKSGGSSNVTVNNCSVNGAYYGGHSAGGLIGSIKNCGLNVSSTDVIADVGATDYHEDTYSGGFIGEYFDADSSSIAQFTFCSFNGTNLCRRTSGGFIGRLNDGDLDVSFVECSSVGGVAGTNGIGGFVGKEENVRKLRFENSFNASEFDGTSLDATVIHSGSWFFMDDIIIEPTSEDLYNNHPASFVGNSGHVGKYEFSNCYKNSKYPSFGNKGDDTSSKFEITDALNNEFSDGSIAYKLNNYGSSPAHFGQVIDDLSLNSTEQKQYVPIPNFNARVYKDEISAQTIYTNYNPRNMNVHTIFIRGNHVNVAPECEYFRVLDKSSFNLKAAGQPGYDISEVCVIDQKTESSQVLKETEYSNDKVKEYKIDKVIDNLQIEISTEPVKPVKPEGSGVKGDPYIINNSLELYWFNQNFSASLFRDVHVKLGADIDYSGLPWKQLYPIAQMDCGYCGTFDGCGHTISGITTSTDNVINSFFGCIDGGTVANLTINGNFDAAGLAYSLRSATISNCKVYGTVAGESQGSYGGIAAYACANTQINSCQSWMEISGKNGSASAGIVGTVTDSSYLHDIEQPCDVTITACKNFGNISSCVHYSGGIVGSFNNWDYDDLMGSVRGMKLSINDCENDGLMYSDSSSTNSAGILGTYNNINSYNSELFITGCINYGSVGYNPNGSICDMGSAGGILCVAGSDARSFISHYSTARLAAYVDSCINKGRLYSVRGYAGGFVAEYKSADSFHLSNCASLGSVDSGNKCGMYTGANTDSQIIHGDLEDYAPDFIADNLFHYDNGVDVDGADCIHENDDGVSYAASNEMISSGELAYRMNENSWQHNLFGQNIDVFSRTDKDGNIHNYTHQTSPNIQSDDTLIVNKNEGDLSKFLPSSIKYTNHNLSDFELNPDATYYDIEVTTEGEGYVDGICKVESGKFASFDFYPMDGWTVDYYELDEKRYEISSDFHCSFEVHENHKLKVYFTQTKEPAKVDDEWLVKDSFELRWLANNQEEVENTPKIKLASNILIKNDLYIDSIGDDEHPFKGIFNGAGYSISTSSTKPFFGCVDSADSVIKDLNIEYAPYSGGVQAALIKTAKNVTLDNIHISGSVGSSLDTKDVGGLIYEVREGTVNITNCISDLTINNNLYVSETRGSNSAFVARYYNGNLNINKCTNNGGISGYTCGGAIGSCVYGSSAHEININKFVNNAPIIAYGDSKSSQQECYAGGVIGWNCPDSDQKVYIDRCVNNSQIAGFCAGGIFGGLDDSWSGHTVTDANYKISACSNYGSITSTQIDNPSYPENLGGIVGCINADDSKLRVEDSIVICDLIGAAHSISGGIFGNVPNTSKIEICSCFVNVKTMEGEGKQTGLMIGELDDMDHYFNNTYLHSEQSRKKIGHYGILFDIGLDDDGYDKVNTHEIESGKIAYKLNEHSNSPIGQVIDYPGQERQFNPVVNSPIDDSRFVYKIDNDIYTNIEGSDPDRYMIQVSPLEGSKEPERASLGFFVDKDEASKKYDIDLMPKRGDVLQKLIVNGEEIDIRESVVDNKYTISNISSDMKIEYYFGECQKPKGDGTENNPYEVTNANELMWISMAVNSGETCLHAVISRDIDMSNYSWIPIGSNESCKFGGKITSKNDAIITGLNGNCCGFIGFADNATVGNLKLQNVHFTNNDVGVLAYNFNNGDVYNVTVDGIVDGCTEKQSGLIAVIGDLSQKQSKNGWSDKGVRIFNCSTHVQFTTLGGFNKNAKVGGFVSYVCDNANLVINGCFNNSSAVSNSILYGSSADDDFAGGMIACINNNCSIDVINSSNNGDITGHYAGGIIGGCVISKISLTQGYINIHNCPNKGIISGKYCGGIIGTFSCSLSGDYNFPLDISDSINEGFVYAKNGSVAGGIIGQIDSNVVDLRLLNCSNAGDIFAKDYAAGLIAAIKHAHDTKIWNSYIYGKINGGAKSCVCMLTKLDSSECTVNNIYWWNQSTTITHSGAVHFDDAGESFNLEDLISGEIGYLLNDKSRPGTKCSYGQVIDDISENKDKELWPHPVSDYDIYKVEDKLYSNFEGSKYFLTVTTKNSDEETDLYSDKGDVFLLNADGSVGTSVLGKMAFNTKIDRYKFVVKPKDGNIINKIVVDGKDLAVSGGDNEIVFDTAKIAENHSIYVEFAYFKEPMKDPKIENTYYITNYNELLWFANQVNNEDNVTCNAIIKKDIKAFGFNASEWVPIGTSEKPYKGSFIGDANKTNNGLQKNYVISNIEVQNHNNGNAFFGYIDGATIDGVDFSVNISSKAKVAGLVYSAKNSIINNIAVSGSVSSAGEKMAGIVADVSGSNKTTITNCTSNVTMNKATAESGQVAGIVANIAKYTQVDIEGCVNNSELHSNLYDDGVSKSHEDFAGGIVALALGKGLELNIKNCVNNATVRGDRAGGIIASVDDEDNSYGKGATLCIDRCYNKGSVMGDHCGSMLGIIEDVSDGSKCNILACSNEGQIGSLGVVLRNAGGIAGCFDDWDLDILIDGCTNKGSVLNDDKSYLDSGSNINALLDAVGALGATDALFTLCVMGGGWAGAVLFAIDTITSVAFVIQDVITNRGYVDSRAGGLVGYRGINGGDLSIKNSIEFGVLQARDEFDAAVNSFFLPEIKNVYSLSSENKNEDSVKYRDMKTFLNGEVAYSLQESGSAGDFGQVIDLKDSIYAKQGLPFIDAQSYAHVYKKEYTHTDSSGQEIVDNVIYTNYDPKEFKDDPCDLYIKGEYAFDSEKEYGQKNVSLGTFSDVAVEGSRTYGSLQAIGADVSDGDKYQLKTSEGARVIFTPKENYSIYDIDFSIRDLSTGKTISAEEGKKVEIINNDDGSITKYINPSYIDDEEVHMINSFDYKIVYKIDGSVTLDINIPSSIDTAWLLNAKALNNKILVNETKDGSKPTIFYPWNSSKSMPEIENRNWYLTNDVNLTHSWNLPEGKMSLCLNGKELSLEDVANIVIDKSSTELNICDCIRYENVFGYNISDKGYYTFEKIDKNNALREDVEYDGKVRTGVIKNKITDDSTVDKFMFNLLSGSLSVYNVAICQSGCYGAFNLAIDNQDSSFNYDATVFGEPFNDKNNNIHYGTIDINNDLGANSLKVGKNASLIYSEKTSKFADICYHETEKGYINFDKNYSANNPIRISANDDVVLTHGFDKLFKDKIDFNKYFEIIDNESSDDESNWTLCLGDDYLGNEITFNEVWVCRSNESVNIEMSVLGPGNVYPDDKVNIKKDSSAKFHYIADDLASLKYAKHSIIDNKTGAVLKYVDSTELLNSGEFIVENISDIFVDSNTTYEVNNKVEFEFASSKDIALDVKEWQEWNNEYSLPSIASQDNLPIGYKLKTDIRLDSVWLVPDGKLVVDLCGHTISFNTDTGYKNDNLIYINHENTILTITDSDNANKKHAFKLNDKQQYELTDDYNNSDSVEINGGLIYGSNTQPSDYRKFNYTAGAIVVENGALNLHKGNVAGNNNSYIEEHESGSLDGGAAITVKEEGKLNVYSGARIACNTCYGDIEYNSQFFAAGIASKGKLYNEGLIDNNIALSYASAAVVAIDGSFENTGTISYNQSLKNKNRNEGLNSFEPVLSYVDVKNAGKVINNYADFYLSSVSVLGTLTLTSFSEISGNKVDIKDEAKVDELDLILLPFMKIKIGDNLQKTKPSVILASNDATITSDWMKSKLKIEDAFKLHSDDTQNNDDKEKLAIAIGEGGELKVVESDRVTNVNVEVMGHGGVSLQNDVYVTNQDIPLTITPDDGNFFNSVILNGAYVDTAKEANDDACISFETIEDDNSINSDSSNVQNVKVYFDTQGELNSRGDKKMWYASKNLPEDSGDYIIDQDVFLEGPWVVSEGDVKIDLMGHKIIQTFNECSAVLVTDSTTTLTIDDSNKAEKHYLSSRDGAFGYFVDDNDTSGIEINGGVIGGVYGTNIKTEHASAITVIEGQVNLNAGNIVGNNALCCNTGAAIDVADNAKLTIGKNAYIAYNSATAVDNKIYETVAAVMTAGNVINYGRIDNNIAYNEYATSSVYVYNNGIFDNHGFVQKEGKDWYDNKTLPKDGGKYILQQDIELDNVWEAPNAYIVIDLNGHSIIQTKASDYVIKVTGTNSRVVIRDFSATASGHLAKVSSKDNMYVIDKAGDISVEGSLIGHSSYIAGESKGAILVSEGLLSVEKATIAGNNIEQESESGYGSAITVGDCGRLLLGEPVNIAYNYSSGNSLNNVESASVYSLGQTISHANIFNNTAENNSVAGIYLNTKTDSIINGKIKNNYALNNSVSAFKLVDSGFVNSEAFVEDNVCIDNSQTIDLSNSKLTNSGWIRNNYSKDKSSFAGIYIQEEKSSSIEMGYFGCIYNNLHIDDSAHTSIHQDLFINQNSQIAPISVSGVFNNQLQFGPIYISTNEILPIDKDLFITSGYIKKGNSEEEIKNLFRYSSDLPDEYFLADCSEQGEVYIHYDSNKKYPWTKDDSLPLMAGKYVLLNDVYLNDTWNVPNGMISIDLNGHIITTRDHSKQIINIDNENKNLIIEDSSSGVVHHLKQNSDNTFELSDEGGIEISGGLIGGSKLLATENTSAISISAGSFTLNGGTLAANTLDGAGNSSINGIISVSNNANVNIGKCAKISYNTVFNGHENNYSTSVISASDSSKLVNRGIISNNYAKNQASIVSNHVNAEFVNSGSIQNNQAVENAVASVFVPDRSIFTNDGFIKNNKAVKDSYILLNKAQKDILNNDDGEICENEVSENSYCVYLDDAHINNNGSIWGNKANLVEDEDNSYSGIALAGEDSQVVFDNHASISDNLSINEGYKTTKQGILNVGLDNVNAPIKFGSNFSVSSHIVVDCTELDDYGFGTLTENFAQVYNFYKDYEEFFETDDETFTFVYNGSKEVDVQRANKKMIYFYESSIGGRASVSYDGRTIGEDGMNVPVGSTLEFNYEVTDPSYEFAYWYDIENDEVIDSPQYYTVEERAIIVPIFKSKEKNTSIRVFQKNDFKKKWYDVRLFKRYSSSDWFNLGHSSASSLYWANVDVNDVSAGIYDLQLDYNNIGKSCELHSEGGITIMTFDPSAKLSNSAMQEDILIQEWKEANFLPPSCGFYKLNRDVYLDETYIPDIGTTTIDLNGFNIIQNEENESAIYINDPSTKLIIEDTSFTGVGVSTRTNHLKKISEDMDYYVLDDFGDIAVAGGIIGGCAFNGKTTSGAIVVEEGSLELNGGTIAANKLNASDCSDDVIGSAGLTVLSNGSAIVGKEATIALNSVLGNNSITRGASAAIYNLGTCQMNGWIVNNQASDNAVAGIYTGAGSKLSTAGLIESNFAYNNSCSALGCSAASLLENKGTIRLNECYSGSCCVELNDVTLTNTGFIYNNVAYDQDSFAGVYFSNNNSKICIDCSSQIYDNKCIDKDTKNVVRKQDFIFAENVQSPIIIGPSLDINGIRGTSSIYFKSLNDNENIQLTQGYLHNSTVDYLSNTPLVSEYEDSCVVIGKDANGNDELFFTKNKNPDLITVNISSNDNSALNISGEMRVMKSANISIPLRAVATYYYFIDELIIDGQQQSLPDNLKTYTTNVAFNSNTNVQVKFSKITKTMSGMMPNIPAKISVTDEASLLAAINNPQLGANTEIRLDNDITLSKSLNPNENSNININLNGHILTSQSGSVITLVNKNCNMLVFDTSETVRKYQKNTRGDNNYVLSDNAGDIEIVGGAIYGGHAEKGAGIYVAEGNSLNLKGANVIGCVAQDEGGAIYNEGLTEIDEWCTVAGNCAERGAGVFNCINAKSVNSDVKTMQQRKCATLINAGNITFNTAIALHKTGLRYADCNLEGAGVYNKGLFNIKSASDISQNYICNRNVDETSPLKRFLSDLHLNYEYGQNVSKIRLVGDLLSSKPYCLTVSNLNGTESAVITEGFSTYSKKINNEEFISTAGTKYRIFKSNDGELGITPASYSETTR